MTVSSIEDISKKEIFRQTIFESLILLNHPREAERFRGCGESVKYICESCGHKKAVARNCESRLCPDCSRKTAARQVKKLIQRFSHIEKRPHWSLKLITLTIKTDGEFRKAVERLSESITKLWNNYLYEGTLGRRRSKKGNQVLSGLVVAFEFGEETGNLHAHCIYYGRYIPQDELTEVWRKITKDSYIVDVRRIRKGKEGMVECIKYMTNLEKCEPSRLVDYFEALKGKRRIRTFGVFYGINFKDKKEGGPACEECGGTSWITEVQFEENFRKARDELSGFK